MARVTGPIKPRLNIAAALKRLREEAGKSLAEVAEDLMISTSKLSRLENAQGRPLPRDIRDLISYYQVGGTPLGNRMRRWVAEAQRPGWWTDYGDDVLGELDAHIAYEADATVERAYTLPFVPALLQTQAYARAHIHSLDWRSADYARASFEDTLPPAAGDGAEPGPAGGAEPGPAGGAEPGPAGGAEPGPAGGSPAGRVNELVEVRMRRQDVLVRREGLEPLQLVAVIHESALRQAVGSPGILCDQLTALLDRSAAPNITLHVLPFTARPVFTMTCMYAYFEYQDPDYLEQDVVNVETPAGFFTVQDPRKVADYRKWHDALVQASLDEDDSRRIIGSLRDSMLRERLQTR